MATEASCYIIRAGQPAQGITLEAVSDHLQNPDEFIWIALHDPDAALLARLGEELGLHELALEDALTTHQRPKLEEYGDYVFISARTVQLLRDQVQFGESHFFASPHYLATIRYADAPSFAKARERLAGVRKSSGLAPFALYSVLDFVTDHYQQAIHSVHESFRELENTLLDTSLERDDLEELYTLKRTLSRLRDITEPMQGIIQDLVRLHPEFVSKDMRAYYRDVLDHAVRITNTIDMLRVSASDAMQFHLAALTLKQNDSVQKLAGWGAILAVPTVIFSLYGMNFIDMPELHWRWSYPVVLAATIGIASWLYRHLKKRGWI